MSFIGALADLTVIGDNSRSDNSNALQSCDDKKLVELFQKTGGDEVFEVIVRRYKDKVFALATSIMGWHAGSEADDATQEVFVEIYRSLGSFRGESAFATWLYRVARNQISGFRRRPRHRSVLGSESGLLTIADTNKDADLQSSIQMDETQNFLHECVGKLPEVRRTAVRLFYWQEQSVTNIAALLDLEPNTVKSHLRRARISLAKMMEDRSYAD